MFIDCVVMLCSILATFNASFQIVCYAVVRNRDLCVRPAREKGMQQVIAYIKLHSSEFLPCDQLMHKYTYARTKVVF